MNRNLDVKKASVESQRRRMNERRAEMTEMIRKKKRSHLVSRKRRATSQTAPATSPNAVDNRQHDDLVAVSFNKKLYDVAWEYIRDKDSNSLISLQLALSRNNQEVSDLFSNDFARESSIDDNTAAMQLARTLEHTLSHTDSTDEMKLMAARVLTNLAAIDHGRNVSEDYYQWQPIGWCDVLVTSQALAALILVMQSSIGAMQGIQPTNISEINQQCCVAIGNIASDSQNARDKALDAGALPVLSKTLEIGVLFNNGEACRNAAFALSNLARGTSPGLAFAQNMSPLLLTKMLQMPEQKSTLWSEVDLEICWVLAFVSAKEDEAVDLLMQTGDLSFSGSHHVSSVCEGIASRLESSTKGLQTADSVDLFAKAVRDTIPCLRVVGNVATACEGRYVPLLLEAKRQAIAKSLATLLELGSFPSANGSSDIMTVAAEAAWASGSLLCDAGHPNHPSTRLCPTMLPYLARAVTSEYAKTDLKREAVSSIWNAVTAPPPVANVRIDISREIENNFCASLCAVSGFVGSLVELLTGSDMDAMLASVQVLNIMLRNDESENNARQAFAEASGVDVLEQVCDRASQQSLQAGSRGMVNAMDQSANIAADLIDDLFSEEDVDDSLIPSMSEGSGTYNFGVTNANMEFQFGVSSVASGTLSPQGRGRGKPTPAWMTNPTSSRVRSDSGPAATYPW